MAVSFYINNWDEDLDNLMFNQCIDNDELLFNKSFIDWCKENDIEPFFVSRRYQYNIVSPVKYSIFTTTNEVYDKTISKHDALYFEDDDDAVLFKLTWL